MLIDFDKKKTLLLPPINHSRGLTIILSGLAKGADTLAVKYANEHIFYRLRDDGRISGLVGIFDVAIPYNDFTKHLLGTNLTHRNFLNIGFRQTDRKFYLIFRTCKERGYAHPFPFFLLQLLNVRCASLQRSSHILPCSTWQNTTGH